MTRLIQPSFAGGEVSREIAARVDLAKRAVAVEKAENFTARVEGGMASRAGQRFVAQAKSSTVRLLPFEFNSEQTFVVELGDQYIRFHSQGGQIVEAAKTITGCTSTTITATAHGYATGDEVYLTGLGGITNLNGRNVKVTVTGANTFTVSTLEGAAITITGTYTSGGTAQRVYTVASPYTAAQLFDVSYAQSGDVLTLCHPSHPPYELVRITNTSWTMLAVSFTPEQSPPTSIAVVSNYAEKYEGWDLKGEQPVRGVAKSGSHGLTTGTEVNITGNSTTIGNYLNGLEPLRVTAVDGATILFDGTDQGGVANVADSTLLLNVTGDGIRYKVTAVAAGSNTESQAGTTGTTYTITGVTTANPCVVTLSGTAAGGLLKFGDEFEITGVVGMTQLNGRRFMVLSVTTGGGATQVTLMTLSRSPVNSTAYSTYVSGGTVRLCVAIVSRAAQKFDNTISWTAATNAVGYNIYRSTVGSYVFIGTTISTEFRDEFIEDDSLETCPQSFNPFEEGAGYYPSTTGFFQQRQIYANSVTYPSRFWMTQAGTFYSFSTASPLRDDDSIVATIAANRINEIRHILPLSDLLLLTSGGEYRIKGSTDEPFTPATISIKPQSFYGSTSLSPIVAGDVGLYMSLGQAVREISYDFASDKFSGMDLTVLARHLFDYNDVVDWAFAPSPYANVWCVRDDGICVVLTYKKEQEVYAWTRATTLGKYKSVTVVREGDHDVVYFAVERVINNVTKVFIERLDERLFEDLPDAFCVDAGLSLDAPITITNATAADPVVITAPSHGLSNGNTVDISGIFEKTTENTQRKRLSQNYNGYGFTVANATTNTFALYNAGDAFDGSGFAAFSSGGVVRKAVTTVSGLWHLEGETVVAAANGYAYTGLTVTNGSVTLPIAASRIHVGLPYICQITTLPLATYTNGASSLGAAKNISSLTIQLERTLGMWTGPSEDQMREAKFGMPANYGQPIQMVNDEMTVTLKGDWSKQRQVVVQQRAPLPMSVLAMAPDVVMGGLS
jgi:hypothetical protein